MWVRFWGIVVTIIIIIGQGCINSNPEIISLIKSDKQSLDSNGPNQSAVKNWWNTQYPSRIPFEIDNRDHDSDYQDMPVLLRLRATDRDLSLVESSKANLRVIDSSDQTELDFEIVKWDIQDEILIWVKFPLIPKNSLERQYFIYFGGDQPGVSGAKQGDVWSSFSNVWHLEEPQIESEYLDSAGKGDHLLAIDSPTSEEGVIGAGVGLLNDTDALESSVDLALILGKTSTLSFWMKTEQSGRDRSYWSPGVTGVESSGDGNDIFFGWLTPDGKLGLQAGDGLAIKSEPVNDNEWRHFTMSRATSGEIRMYINGALIEGKESAPGEKTTSFYQFGVIQSTKAGEDKNFNGSLDEIRIVNGLLSDERIEAEYRFQMGTHVHFFDLESL